MRLAQFSVNNSLLVNVISIFLIFAGIIAVSSLNREAFPNIRLDTVLIQTAYPGSTPEEVEKLITIPIEAELKQVDHIDEMISISAEGMSAITIDIDEDAPNPDRVINEIQRAVDRTDDLPEDLEDKPVVHEVTTQNQPVITISLSGKLPETKLQEHAKSLERLILETNGVGKIVRSGWRDKEIWVEIKPETMQAMHVSLLEAIESLKKHNVSIPGGNLYQDKAEYIIRTSGEFETPDEIGEVIVRANPAGQRIRVKDVASVYATFEEEKIINKTNGTRAINLTVIKKPSGDTIDIVKNVQEISDNFKTNADPGLEISFVNDLSFYIKRRLNVLVTNGWLGMLLVIVIVFTFLSFRVAVGACLGIPISILTTLAIMSWFGISINLLTMFAMIMVIGMLVDEDIVISENIHRHLELNKPPINAILDGVSEVSRAVIATVATTVAAFIPLYLMSGVMGKFIINIPIVVNITLLASLTVALIILPSHLFHLTGANKKRHLHLSAPIEEKKFFVHLLEKYTSALKKVLHYRYRFIGIVSLILLICIFNAIIRMPFVLFPSRGIDIFFIRVEGDLGDRLEVTEKNMRPIENILSKLPEEELENFVTQIGITQQDPDDPYTNRGSHLGQVVVYLTPEAKRKRDSDEIIESLRKKIEPISTFKTLSFDRVKHGPPVGKAIQVRIRGDDLGTLKVLANKFKKALEKLPGVTDIKDDSEEVLDEITIQINAEAASQASLTVRDLATTVRAAFEGAVATTIKKSDEEINVIVRLPTASQWVPSDLENLLISNPYGNLIPLKRVAQIEKTEGMRVIKHDDRARAATVTANVDEKVTTAMRVNQALQKRFSDISISHPGYTVHYGGEQEETQESLQSLFRALYIAVGLIFVILVTMFRSVILPFVILFTIPFAAIGVVIAFEIHRLPLSFMALLGMVGLTGVVANSGIIIIDFIQRARKKGMDLTASIIEGSKTRFRPVILTSLTTAFGVIPAAYGLGGLDPFIQPMALTLNFGLLFGAALTLFLIPCFVAVTDDLRSYSEKKIKRLKDMNLPGKILKKVTSTSIFFILVSFTLQNTYAAPVPPSIMVNHSTKQCSEFFPGDECIYCSPPEEWEDIGNAFTTKCPPNYKKVDISPTCERSKSQFCCMEGHSGVHGDCNDMVMNKKTKECAFLDSVSECKLPKGWIKKPIELNPNEWSCPFLYKWIKELKCSSK